MRECLQDSPKIIVACRTQAVPFGKPGMRRIKTLCGALAFLNCALEPVPPAGAKP